MERVIDPWKVWALAHWQHGVVSRPQLLNLGCTADVIDHRIERGRLHRVARACMQSDGRS